ncbi:MAG: hypothetical protein ACRCTG_16585 [Aestuariivirga sp.]
MKIVSLQEARSLDLKWYFNGVPCKNGHVAERLVSNQTCRECSAERTKAWRERSKEHCAEYAKNHYLSNYDARIDSSRKWKRENLEKVLSYSKKYREKNKPQTLSKMTFDRIRKRGRVPVWFGEFDWLVWEEAADLVPKRRECTGISWHADHMIPMSGKTASGLHVHSNCQVIPAVLNLMKRNKMVLSEPLEWLAHI